MQSEAFDLNKVQRLVVKLNNAVDKKNGNDRFPLKYTFGRSTVWLALDQLIVFRNASDYMCHYSNHLDIEHSTNICNIHTLVLGYNITQLHSLIHPLFAYGFTNISPKLILHPLPSSLCYCCYQNLAERERDVRR